MEYAPGQLIRNPAFGLGKVLRVKKDGSEIRVWAFFKDRPDVRNAIRADMVPMEILIGQNDPWLDNLDPAVMVDRAVERYMTHADAVSKFKRYFPLGFADPRFDEYERGYKVEAHELWRTTLGRDEFRRFLDGKQFEEVCVRAIRVEGKTNLLSRFEKAALHDALKVADAQGQFAAGLFDLIYGDETFEHRFGRFSQMLEALPQPQSETLKWPIQTIFAFLALPKEHLFLKPDVTQQAAKRRAFSLNYQPRPNWLTYTCLLRFGELLVHDLADLKPRDMIDIQSFIWVTGDDSYKA